MRTQSIFAAALASGRCVGETFAFDDDDDEKWMEEIGHRDRLKGISPAQSTRRPVVNAAAVRNGLRTPCRQQCRPGNRLRFDVIVWADLTAVQGSTVDIVPQWASGQSSNV